MAFHLLHFFYRGGYTVLINTWKRNSLLKQSVAHYASCSGTDAIHVVWSESDPPSDKLRAYLKNIVLKKSQTAHKPNFRFDLNKEDNLNNRFKPIEDLRTDAIFSIDDDVIVPCRTLDFAFTVWQSAPQTMVGFVPRMHWLDEEVSDVFSLSVVLLQLYTGVILAFSQCLDSPWLSTKFLGKCRRLFGSGEIMFQQSWKFPVGYILSISIWICSCDKHLKIQSKFVNFTTH